MGLCLPDSCSPENVKELFHFVRGKLRNESSAKVVIELVRNLSNGYSFWEDPVFYVLAYVLIILYREVARLRALNNLQGYIYRGHRFCDPGHFLRHFPEIQSITYGEAKARENGNRNETPEFRSGRRR